MVRQVFARLPRMGRFKFPLMLVLMIAANTWASEPKGFKHISFGANWQTVLEEVMKMGFDPKGQGGNRLVISEYRIGDLPVQVDFIFNQNNKFCAYELRTGRVDKGRYPKVIEAAKYLSGLFSQKWGTPTSKNYPRMEEIKRSGTLYWTWKKT